jgi:hypothetical protein
VCASIEFDRDTMFEAVEIENDVFAGKLAAEFRAEPTVAQEFPGGLFGLGWMAA